VIHVWALWEYACVLKWRYINTLSFLSFMVFKRWLGSLLVRALDSRLDGREFDSRPPPSPGRIAVWMTVSELANYLSTSPSHPGKLSLLPSAGREMSTSRSELTLCGRGVKAGMVHSTCGWACEWQVKLYDPSLTRAIPERPRDEQLIVKCYTQIRLSLSLNRCLETGFKTAMRYHFAFAY